MITIYTDSEESTINLGKKFAEFMKKGIVVFLKGDLGVGKTHFVKGFAKGLGIKDTITSPTFNIVNSYTSENFNLNHFDVYRVRDEDEIIDIGFEEYIYSDDISVIEWAQLIQGILPEDYIEVTIEKTDIESQRKITFNFSSIHRDMEEEFNDNTSR